MAKKFSADFPVCARAEDSSQPVCITSVSSVVSISRDRSRAQKVRLGFVLWMIVVFAGIAVCETRATAADRPNIVLILSDDQAWGDYGFMGHPAIKTPHLDKLAAESLTFRRAYVPASLCCPRLTAWRGGIWLVAHLKRPKPRAVILEALTRCVTRCLLEAW